MNRYDELELMQKLVHEVSAINNGTHCLERIARCIKMADELTAISLDTERPSFVGWLRILAIDDGSASA